MGVGRPGGNRCRGQGRVYSWTVVAHQVHPAFPAPYTLVLVELDDHPEARMVGSIPGRHDFVAGQQMEAWFETVGEDVVLPQWRPVDGEGRGVEGEATAAGPA